MNFKEAKETIKDLLNFTLEEFLKSGKYQNRLKKMLDTISKFKDQFKTSGDPTNNNKKKKKKVEKKKFLDIPRYVIFLIAYFTPYEVVYNLLLTNKYLRNLLKDNNFWRIKFRIEYPNFITFVTDKKDIEAPLKFLDEFFAKYIYKEVVVKLTLSKIPVKKKVYKKEISWKEFKDLNPPWYITTIMLQNSLKHFAEYIESRDYYRGDGPYLPKDIPIEFYKNEFFLIELYKRIYGRISVSLSNLITSLILRKYFKFKSENIDSDFLVKLIEINYNSFKAIFRRSKGRYNYDRKKVIVSLIESIISKKIENKIYILEGLIEYYFGLLRDYNYSIELNKKDVVETLIKFNGSFLRYFNKYQNDEKMALLALKTSTTFDILGDYLKKDDYFIKKAVRVNGAVLLHVDEKFSKLKSYISDAVKTFGEILTYHRIDKKFLEDREIILNAAKNYGKIIDTVYLRIKKKMGKFHFTNPKYLNYESLLESFLKDEELIFEAIKSEPEMILRRYLSKYKYYTKTKFIETALENCKSDRKSHRNLAVELLKLNEFYFKFLNNRCKGYWRHTLKSFLKKYPILFIYDHPDHKKSFTGQILEEIYYKEGEKEISKLRGDDKRMKELFMNDPFKFFIIAFKENKEKLRNEIEEFENDRINKPIMITPIFIFLY
jgi:hypothetical protein